jgi:hypothetical protein
MASLRDFKKAVKDILHEHQMFCSLAAGLQEGGDPDKAFETATLVYRDTMQQVDTILANMNPSSEVKNKRAHYRALYEQVLKVCQENEEKLAQQFGLK